MTVATTPISNTEDLIDVRDVIERFEWLNEEDGDLRNDELRSLTALLDNLKGYGGDEQWRGDWYPISLIRDSYFEAYAREFADDIGAVNHDIGWPQAHIDWSAAARALQQDYSTVAFDGVIYWYR
jgi:hypothetical protein